MKLLELLSNMADSRSSTVRKNMASATIIPLFDKEETAEGDAQLMQRLAAGERSAFAVLVRRHTPRFYRVAYRFTGSRVEAEDMVQEAFLKLWERPLLWQADRNTAFTTWFYRIVVNLCLDHRKKKRPALMSDNGWVADERESQEEAVLAQEKERWMQARLAALPDRQRIALTLCFYEELSNQEAADAMGIRLKALQSLLMRAKTTLKDQLREHWGG